MIWKAILLSAFVAWLSHGVEAEPTWVVDCDGTPPKLVNKDGTAHDYSIKCPRKTETGSIAPNSSKKLKKKAGCMITVGSNKATKLRSEMVCTIEGGALTCELL